MQLRHMFFAPAAALLLSLALFGQTQNPPQQPGTPGPGKQDHMAMRQQHMQEMKASVEKMRSMVNEMKANADKIQDPAAKQHAQLDTQRVLQ